MNYYSRDQQSFKINSADFNQFYENVAGEESNSGIFRRNHESIRKKKQTRSNKPTQSCDENKLKAMA